MGGTMDKIFEDFRVNSANVMKSKSRISASVNHAPRWPSGAKITSGLGIYVPNVLTCLRAYLFTGNLRPVFPRT